MYKWLNKALLQDCCLFPSRYHCVAHPGLELRPASCLSLPEAGTAGLSHHTQATLQMVSIRIFLPKTQPTSFLLLRPRFITLQLFPPAPLESAAPGEFSGCFCKGADKMELRWLICSCDLHWRWELCLAQFLSCLRAWGKQSTNALVLSHRIILAPFERATATQLACPCGIFYSNRVQLKHTKTASHCLHKLTHQLSRWKT